MLAEATDTLGERVTRKAARPRMHEYIRVKDYREQQLLVMPDLGIFRDSLPSAQDVLDVSADHVAIATGATWRPKRFDVEAYAPLMPEGRDVKINTPDDIMAGDLPKGTTLIFDTDGYDIGGVIAERLRQAMWQACPLP